MLLLGIASNENRFKESIMFLKAIVKLIKLEKATIVKIEEKM